MLKRNSTTDDVRRVALAAFAAAVDEARQGRTKKKPRLGGVGAVAAGAAIFTAGRAAASNRFVRERLASLKPQLESREEEEPVEEEEAAEEPEAAQEPEAAEEEEAAEEREAAQEPEAAEEETRPSRRPPVHREEEPEESREPVGKA